jgi:hypothetical protein
VRREAVGRETRSSLRCRRPAGQPPSCSASVVSALSVEEQPVLTPNETPSEDVLGAALLTDAEQQEAPDTPTGNSERTVSARRLRTAKDQPSAPVRTRADQGGHPLITVD